MISPKIFISHSHNDEILVDKFVDLLDTGCGVKRADIFCSSLPGMGVEPGKDFLKHIKDEMDSPLLVILFLSENYYESVFCVCELGATWVLDRSIFPIIVPPLKISDVKATLATTHMGSVNDSVYLDQLRDNISPMEGIEKVKTATWSVKKDLFLQQFPEIRRQLPKPTTVSLQQYEQLEEKYNILFNELLELNKQLDEEKELNKKLRQTKDKEEFNRLLLENNKFMKIFEDMTGSVTASLDNLPRVVRIALFYSWNDKIYYPENSEDADMASHHVDKGYLIELSDGGCEVRLGNYEVKEAWKALGNLYATMSKADENFVEAFEQQHKIEFSLEIKPFWEKVFWEFKWGSLF